MFIIIPMLNIDGVIMGNSRACFQGIDPNRLWNPKQKFPLVTINIKYQNVESVKEILYLIKKYSKLEMFIDIHGSHKKYIL